MVSLLVLVFLSAAPSPPGDDPCSCQPKRGTHPYRLAAKTETDFSRYHAKKRRIGPARLREWQDKYAARAHNEIDPEAGRLKKTPEDSIYTLEGWIHKVIKEIDCDYHIIIGGKNPQDPVGEVEVTEENCDAKKAVLDAMKKSGSPFDQDLAQPLHCVVQGLGFYDGQHGVKKLTGTAWELHPVKSIKFLP